TVSEYRAIMTACVVAWLAAFWLRFNLDVPQPYVTIALYSLTVVLGAHLAAFWSFGLYRGIWRFASLPDLRRIILAVGLAAVIVTSLLYMLRMGVPRSVLIMNPLLLVMIMGGSRLAYRAWKERRLHRRMPQEREPIFVLGADQAAVNLVKELAQSTQWRVVGMLDEDGAKVGRQVHGVNVLGGIA